MGWTLKLHVIKTSYWKLNFSLQDLSFSNILTLLWKFSKIRLLTRTKLNSLMWLMIYMHYWLPFFKNDNFKYTTASQRLTFNSFSLYHIFLSDRFLSYYLFSNSYAQRNTMPVIYIAYRILWEFLLCNILHSVRNMHWWTFLRELFLLLFPTN